MYKKVVKFSYKRQKIFWVLVFSFMYLVLVDAMDKSKDNITIRFTLWGSSDITDQYIVYFLVYLEEGGKFKI